MKTPRQAHKENFWIGAKGGLLDQKHVKAMGDAVWLFLYLLRGQTGINEWKEGLFDYGHPHTLKYISDEFGGTSERTIHRWIGILRKAGYIQTESHSNQGMTFWIAKAKDKTKKPRVTEKVRAKLQPVSAKTPYAERVASPENSLRETSTEFQNSLRDSVKESLQTAESAQFAAPIPKDFISESPSYYNKPADAKSASVVSSLLGEAARKLQPPRRTSQVSLDERRRLLLRQSEEMQAKYGKAVTA
jgi:SOS-response transcriptional repressor LexA